eukprot:TRINITY_DN953_c0_g2_i4.p2 TRINITY_DN953_c0_g2~~TRINITY_DN953_c0_g2_i4.p2  ORF type:complete len:181 (-),score=41.50 TRINITY_DN953_c0_g2_i4:601-1143(-)
MKMLLGQCKLSSSVDWKARSLKQLSKTRVPHQVVLGVYTAGMLGMFAHAAQARTSSGIYHKTISSISSGNLRLCVSPTKTRKKRKGGGNFEGGGDGGDEGGFGGGWWNGGGGGGDGDDSFFNGENWFSRGRIFASFVWILICWTCFVQTVYFLLFVSLPRSPFLACLASRKIGLVKRMIR